MTGLLIQGNQCEQDIKELLTSFYPGEICAYEVKDGPDPYMETRLGDSAVPILIWESGATPEGWKLSDSRTRPSDLSDRFATKSVIEKMFYLMLAVRTGEEMPWGSLTSIRPIETTLTRLEEDWKEEDIRSFMKETYLANDEKTGLSIEVVTREKKLLEPLDYERGYSPYMGIPFCPTTCPYCSFISYPIEKWRECTGLYLGVLLKELEYTARKMEGRPLDMVYPDGGIPTPLPAKDLEALSGRLEQLSDLSCALGFIVGTGRLDSITSDKLKVLRDHGITRISTNPQTMNQKILDLIEYHHTVEMVKERFYITQELGFGSISMDLIMGLPEENMDDAQRALEEIRVLGPDSLTVHSLVIKKAAKLSMLREEYGGLKIRNTPETIELSAACVCKMGMEPHYLYCQRSMAGNLENVGYPLPGKVCIYNILTMEEIQTVAACDAGTTTKVVFPFENRKECCGNVKEVKQYISRIGKVVQRKERIL